MGRERKREMRRKRFESLERRQREYRGYLIEDRNEEKFLR
jgi:hypothetical protein